MDLRADSPFQRHANDVWRAMQRVAEHEKAGVIGQSEEVNPFSKLLGEGINQVNQAELDSQEKIERLIGGEDINQAEVFTSIQKADMSFRLLVQIRNKLLQAFEELNGIRV